MKLLPVLLVLMLLTCFSGQDAGGNSGNKEVCSVLIDAGSSGIRAYVYDPDLKELFDVEIKTLVDPLKAAGRGQDFARCALSYPLDASKKKRCNLKTLKRGLKSLVAVILKPENKRVNANCKPAFSSIKVYATAGMRLAEQKNRRAAFRLWRGVRSVLGSEFGKAAKSNAGVIEARTITGFEEGLYAYLAVDSINNSRKKNFAVMEVGGASAQIAFPCDSCPDAKEIRLSKDRTIKLYSRTYLGIGINEYYKPFKKTCVLKEANPNRFQACSEAIDKGFNKSDLIPDPFNESRPGGERSEEIKAMAYARKNMNQYFALGVFKFYRPNPRRLKKKAEGICPRSFEEERRISKQPAKFIKNRCFAHTYMSVLLTKVNFEKPKYLKASWTLGAARCGKESCLSASVRRELRGHCEWMRGWKCLDQKF